MKFAVTFLVMALYLQLPMPEQKKPNPKSSKSWINSIEHDGDKVTCFLPDDQQLKNIGSKVDGAGMCVMSSIEMAARYQGLEQMRGLRDWCSKERGGGYPQKVEQQLEKWFKEKGIAKVPFMQFEGKDPEAILELIDKTRRMAAITYSYSPRYGKSVAHMTNCILYGSKHACVLDNNFPGNEKLEWMEKAELLKRMRQGGGSAWVFVWLTPGSPPAPKQKQMMEQ